MIINILINKEIENISVLIITFLCSWGSIKISSALLPEVISISSRLTSSPTQLAFFICFSSQGILFSILIQFFYFITSLHYSITILPTGLINPSPIMTPLVSSSQNSRQIDTVFDRLQESSYAHLWLSSVINLFMDN